jgi:hypothetical protein
MVEKPGTRDDDKPFIPVACCTTHSLHSLPGWWFVGVSGVMQCWGLHCNAWALQRLLGAWALLYKHLESQRLFCMIPAAKSNERRQAPGQQARDESHS